MERKSGVNPALPKRDGVKMERKSGVKKKSFNNILRIALFLLFSAGIIRLSWPNILRTYIRGGIGSCAKIPVFCKSPTVEIINPQIQQDYIAELVPYEFPKMKARMPKGFNVIQEEIKKIYYKGKKRQHKGDVIYLLVEPPGFFINLFPQLKKQGLNNNYEFLRQTMFAQLRQIRNLSDTFFVVMKGIFTPDLGEQNNVIMTQFTLPDRRGFINYNLGKEDNYFDCNIITRNDVFFKVYIKDKGAHLDLDKVLAIITTLEPS